MNKIQSISKAAKFLEINGFIEKDFASDSKTLTISLTKSGTKKLSAGLEGKLIEMRITIKKADGTTVSPEAIQNPIEKITEVKSEVVKEDKKPTVTNKTEITFEGSLEVFSKKDLSGKCAKMGAATVTLTTLPDTNSDGYNIIGVRKPGSSRIFYTTEDRLPGFASPTEAKVAEVLEAVNTPIESTEEITTEEVVS